MREVLRRGILVLACGLLGCRDHRPDVLLVLIDTLRADHLSAYGYPKPTSPHIDEFARGATLYEHAISQAPHTIPSVLQIMTSRYVQGYEIPPADPTLAEVLRRHGYQTAAVVENANFESERDAHGLMRGFDRFYRNGPLHTDSVEQQHWKTNTPADAITAQAVRWLGRRERGKPVFLWLHYFDPHDPYMPPYADDLEALSWGEGRTFTGDVRRTFLHRGAEGEGTGPLSEADRQHLVDLYDAEIRYVDQSLGELFAALRRDGLYDGALIILSADHGESLGEHGRWMHGSSLYDTELHVPLIVKCPDQERGRRVADPVQAIDIFPTVLDVAGIPGPNLGLEGTTLGDRGSRPAFAFWRDGFVVRTGRWKLLRQGGQDALFSIREDPGELNDLVGEHRSVVERLAAKGQRKLAALRTEPARVDRVSAETIERLRSLGYVR